MANPPEADRHQARRRPCSSVLLAATLLLPWPLAQSEMLLAVRKSDDAVDVIEPGSAARLMSVDVGGTPHEIGVSADGRYAIVTNYGTRELPGNSISLLDLEQPRELARIDLGTHTRPHGVAWFAPDRVAVTTEGSQHLLVIDPHARRIVAEIPTGQPLSHMVAVTPDATRAFVTSIEPGVMTVIDLPGARKLRDIDTGAGSEAVAISPDGREVWVGARGANEIAVVDAETLEVRARLPVAGMPIRIAFAPDGRTAVVSCASSGEVVAIDTVSRTIVARHRLDVPVIRARGGGAAPVGLLVADDGQSVLVAATQADAVIRLSLPDLEPQAVIAVPGEPDGLARSPLLPKYECHACSSD